MLGQVTRGPLVMHPDQQEYRDILRLAYEWRERVASGTLSEREEADFAAWLAEDIRHEEIYDQAETYWAAFDYVGLDDFDEELIRPSFPEQITLLLDRTKSAFSNRAFQVATVAAVAALFTLPLMLSIDNAPTEDIAPEAQMASYSSQIGEVVTVTLSDESTVTLGGNTRIETEFYADQRIVHLSSGAGLFEVSPDAERPFLVKSGETTTTVLGTVFEVRRNGGLTRIAVSEGRVEVAHPLVVDGRASTLVSRKELEAGQQIAATSLDGLRNVSSINPDRVAAWRSQLLLYDGATLAEIIADANRYSEKEILLKNIPDDIAMSEINASFRSSDIDGLLTTLPDLYPVSVDKSDPDKVIVSPTITAQ